MAPESFRQDLVDSRRRLEDLTGAAVSGYRAPSFNIDDGILRIIGAAGFGYDSSYNSFELHGRYGRISLSAAKRNGGGFRIADNFHELPISNLRLFSRVLPWGGGGYFRLIPWPLFAGGVRRIIASNGVYVFYLHPWEIDPGQPRVERASMTLKFRHYTNLKKAYARVAKLLHAFGHCRFTSCRDYLAATVETATPSAIHPQARRSAAGELPN
jgi:polysaccharide deacetylase family protein (PEP-CTERM system associated)